MLLLLRCLEAEWCLSLTVSRQKLRPEKIPSGFPPEASAFLQQSQNGAENVAEQMSVCFKPLKKDGNVSSQRVKKVKSPA